MSQHYTAVSEQQPRRLRLRARRPRQPQQPGVCQHEREWGVHFVQPHGAPQTAFPRPAAAPTQQTNEYTTQARYPREPHRAAYQQGSVERRYLRLRWWPELEDVLCRLGRFIL
ncbi:hypothetical protein MSAN_02281400 [Mycena sanguinolenta]|uniref:Uncharacterized protein n=1 Tax=Mycena sanguinolenta TaxID=230812 RepID=A0A8H7CJ41_9AGAR|nr:hypothetical protein MSAN_02281400 [Mycena sanguinolenta]